MWERVYSAWHKVFNLATVPSWPFSPVELIGHLKQGDVLLATNHSNRPRIDTYLTGTMTSSGVIQCRCVA